MTAFDEAAPQKSARIRNGESYLLGMNTGELETSIAAFAEDASYFGIEKVDGVVSRKVYEGKPAIRAYIEAWLANASGGLTYRIHESTEIGDAVFVKWSDEAHGEQGAYRNEGTMVFEFHDDDSIRHARAYYRMGPLQESSFLDE